MSLFYIWSLNILSSLFNKIPYIEGKTNIQYNIVFFSLIYTYCIWKIILDSFFWRTMSLYKVYMNTVVI